MRFVEKHIANSDFNISALPVKQMRTEKNYAAQLKFQQVVRHFGQDRLGRFLKAVPVKRDRIEKLKAQSLFSLTAKPDFKQAHAKQSVKPLLSRFYRPELQNRPKPQMFKPAPFKPAFA